MSVSRQRKHSKEREDPRKYSRGILRMHRDGFGFVKPEVELAGLEGDIFIPPDSAAKGMHGDRVLVRVKRSGNRAEGDIVKVLDRGQANVTGEFLARRGRYYVRPFDPRIRQWIEIPSGLEIPSAEPNPHRVGAAAKTAASPEEMVGQIVNTQILDYPEDGDNAIGRVIELLGFPDDFGVDVEIMIRKHQLPHEFAEDVLAEARDARQPSEAAVEGREDFRHLDIVTIDGETARDFDDAVWVGHRENGNWELQVHIADVSYYVRRGSAIDREALNRGTSAYFPDRAVPMLPVELSTDICSLRPEVDRLVVSAILEIGHDGETVGARFKTGVIRSFARMTYTRVFEILEAGGDSDEFRRFARMRDLALLLNKKRTRRGSIDFDLPEATIEFDEFGEMIGVGRGSRNIAHRIIEEFMLAANEAVAAHLEGSGQASLYRIHEPPDPQRVLEFEEMAVKFGASLGIGKIPVKKHYMVARTRDGRKVRKDVILADASKPVVTSKHYQRLIDKIAGRPEERILSYLMLRSLKQARYSADNVGHFALASPCYTHFTSPIRRYPDLMVHRILTGRDQPSLEELRKLGDDCSFTERRAAEAERELVEWKKVKFMAERVGDDFDAVIISVLKFGFFVELDDLFIEGLVSIETIPGDRFAYHEGRRAIVGERTGKRYSVGNRVRVLLARVDGVERKLYFSLIPSQR